MNLGLNEDQKRELKNLIEGDGYNLMDDIENAKESLKILAISVKSSLGIEPAMFKKLVKINYQDSLEDERVKFNALDILWTEIFGDTDETEEEER